MDFIEFPIFPINFPTRFSQLAPFFYGAFRDQHVGTTRRTPSLHGAGTATFWTFPLIQTRGANDMVPLDRWMVSWKIPSILVGGAIWCNNQVVIVHNGEKAMYNKYKLNY